MVGLVLSMTAGSAAQQAPQLAQTVTGPAGGWYGRVVAMGDDHFVVGDSLLNSKGEAYVYSRTPSGWAEEAKLGAGLAGPGSFGEAVAVDGSTVVVGDSNDDALGFRAGAAHVFVRQAGAWVLQQTLVASDGVANQEFGQFAEIDGDTCLIGSFKSGRTYVFERTGTVWSEVFQLNDSGTGGGRAFDVIDGERCDRADPGHTIPGFFLTGTVKVYRRERDAWVHEQTLVHDDPDPLQGNNFGRSVALDGDTLIAGATEKDVPGVHCGAAYVFRRSGTMWTQEAKLIATDGDQVEDFGFHVELDGDLAVVSQMEGLGGINSFYVYRRNGSTWDAGVKTIPPVNPNSVGAISLSGNRVLVGAEIDALVNLYVVPEPPAIYCTAKTNSAGCVPALGAAGSPTFAGPDDFVVTASDALPSKPGLLYFGLQPTALPFMNGTLCVLPPLVRLPVQLATAGVACDGTYSFPFPQVKMMQAGLLPGDRFYAQAWSRDPAHPDGTGIGLTDAIEVLILP